MIRMVAAEDLDDIELKVKYPVVNVIYDDENYIPIMNGENYVFVLDTGEIKMRQWQFAFLKRKDSAIVKRCKLIVAW